MNDDYSVTWGPIGPGIPWQWKQKQLLKVNEVKFFKIL